MSIVGAFDWFEGEIPCCDGIDDATLVTANTCAKPFYVYLSVCTYHLPGPLTQPFPFQD